MKKFRIPFTLIASVLVLSSCRIGQDVVDETKTNINILEKMSKFKELSLEAQRMPNYIELMKE